MQESLRNVKRAHDQLRVLDKTKEITQEHENKLRSEGNSQLELRKRQSLDKGTDGKSVRIKLNEPQLPDLTDIFLHEQYAASNETELMQSSMTLDSDQLREIVDRNTKTSN